MNNQVIGDGSVGPSSADFAALREDLEEQRRFRREQLREFAAAASEEGAGAEQAEPSRTEVEAQLAASARMVLDDVEAALERMDHGRYGACQRCGRHIPRAQLAIVPQARYCGGCRQLGGTAG